MRENFRFKTESDWLLVYEQAVRLLKADGLSVSGTSLKVLPWYLVAAQSVVEPAKRTTMLPRTCVMEFHHWANHNIERIQEITRESVTKNVKAPESKASETQPEVQSVSESQSLSINTISFDSLTSIEKDNILRAVISAVPALASRITLYNGQVDDKREPLVQVETTVAKVNDGAATAKASKVVPAEGNSESCPTDMSGVLSLMEWLKANNPEHYKKWSVLSTEDVGYELYQITDIPPDSHADINRAAIVFLTAQQSAQAYDAKREEEHKNPTLTANLPTVQNFSLPLGIEDNNRLRVAIVGIKYADIPAVGNVYKSRFHLGFFPRTENAVPGSGFDVCVYMLHSMSDACSRVVRERFSGKSLVQVVDDIEKVKFQLAQLVVYPPRKKARV
jgi:hypothetical protein